MCSTSIIDTSPSGKGVPRVEFVLFEAAKLAGDVEYKRFSELLFPSKRAHRGAEPETSGHQSEEEFQDGFALDLMKLGTARGKEYASGFVTMFVVWFRDTARLRGPLHVDAIISLAFQVFSVEVGLEMPIVRNFLSVLKRYPDVKVYRDRRMYEAGNPSCKGTFYLLPTSEIGKGDRYSMPPDRVDYRNP